VSPCCAIASTAAVCGNGPRWWRQPTPAGREHHAGPTPTHGAHQRDGRRRSRSSAGGREKRLCLGRRAVRVAQRRRRSPAPPLVITTGRPRGNAASQHCGTTKRSNTPLVPRPHDAHTHSAGLCATRTPAPSLGELAHPKQLSRAAAAVLVAPPAPPRRAPATCSLQADECGREPQTTYADADKTATKRSTCRRAAFAAPHSQIQPARRCRPETIAAAPDA
jgi:hypothetical protein